MFAKCDFDDFRAQYERLCEWMCLVKSMPFGHAFYKLSQHWVRRININDELIAQPFVISRVKVHQASRWQPGWVPQKMTKISCNAHGRCMFLYAESTPDMDTFYKYTMSTHIDEIRARKIWHVVVGWHFYMHAATSSESFSEHVGSFLQELRRSRANQGAKIIAWTTQIKAAGLRGTGSEDGFLCMALNTHFGCSGPEGGHVETKKKGAIGRGLTASKPSKQIA